MTGLISTGYCSAFKNWKGRKNMPFFSLFRSAAHGYIFCMPSRYDQKEKVVFCRSVVQLKAFVYLACVSSFYIAVF